MSAVLPEDRMLEETFRAVLLATFGADVELGTTNQAPVELGQVRKLPFVGIYALRNGDDLNVKSGSRPSSDMEVKFECRTDGNLPASDVAAEDLAGRVKNAVLGADGSFFDDWEMVDAVEFTGTERGSDGMTRVVTQIFKMVTLVAV